MGAPLGATPVNQTEVRSGGDFWSGGDVDVNPFRRGGWAGRPAQYSQMMRNVFPFPRRQCGVKNGVYREMCFSTFQPCRRVIEAAESCERERCRVD